MMMGVGKRNRKDKQNGRWHGVWNLCAGASLSLLFLFFSPRLCAAAAVDWSTANTKARLLPAWRWLYSDGQFDEEPLETAVTMLLDVAPSTIL